MTTSRTARRPQAAAPKRSRRGEAGLHLVISASHGRTFVPFIRRFVLAAHEMLSPPLRELSLALVGNERMAELHERFMNLPGPTDVLTFPLESNDSGAATAGEVVICVPEARRRAAEHGVATRDELLLYAIHGMLHLCGFDDRTGRGFRNMHRKEDEILTALGVGPVFRTFAASGKRAAR